MGSVVKVLPSLRTYFESRCIVGRFRAFLFPVPDRGVALWGVCAVVLFEEGKRPILTYWLKR